jgi:hypothetical protein
MSSARIIRHLAGPAFLVCACAASAATAGAHDTTGVRVASGVVPDTVTVGQRYRAVARITVPPGSRVEVTLAPVDSESVETVGQVKVDTTAAAQGRFGAEVTLVAWKTGPGKAVDALLRVTPPGGAAREVSFPFAAPFVRSVLPEDTAGVRPRGPKDVLDAKPTMVKQVKLPALGLLLFLLLLGLAYGIIRLLRRRGSEEIADPRERSLAALDRIAASGAVERGEWRAVYSGISEAMRDLASCLEPAWGRDLTTGELALRMADDGVPAEDVGTAAAVLDRADLVKFARQQPAAETAREDLAAARAWAARIQPPVRPADSGDGDYAEAEADERVPVGAGGGGAP